MSDRSKDGFREFEKIPNIGLWLVSSFVNISLMNDSAENGMFIKYTDEEKWEAVIENADLSWKKNILELFEYYTE